MKLTENDWKEFNQSLPYLKSKQIFILLLWGFFKPKKIKKYIQSLKDGKAAIFAFKDLKN